MTDFTLLTLTLQKEIEHNEDAVEYIKKRDELIIMLEDMGFSVDIENEDTGEEPFYNFDEDDDADDD